MLARRFALATLALAFAAPASPDGTRAQAGLWEVTATVELSGQQARLPPTTETECLSQADLDADPTPTLDKGSCRATDVRRAGGKVTWKITCDGPVTGSGEGEISYQSPTAYDGFVVMELSGAKVRTTLKARRLGACPKSE